MQVQPNVAFFFCCAPPPSAAICSCYSQFVFRINTTTDLSWEVSEVIELELKDGYLRRHSYRLCLR